MLADRKLADLKAEARRRAAIAAIRPTTSSSTVSGAITNSLNSTAASQIWTACVHGYGFVARFSTQDVAFSRLLLTR